MQKKTIVIGIAGASGSGKTRLAQMLYARLGEKHALLLHHDNYYKDQSDLSVAQRTKINYDHPDSLDTALLIKHLHALGQGHAIEQPKYNFSRHSRESTGVRCKPQPVIIIEGILILSDKKLRSMFDRTVYIEEDDDICFIRRASRDIRERGRDFDLIAEQYLQSVKPMFQQFVLPSKQYADDILCTEHERCRFIDSVVSDSFDVPYDGRISQR